ncbi:MAG TPA: hypothetical protein VI382_07475 [Candidatus Manganitrophaceae bacterium]|nr:hypothetical protein [Candidatus Manganitrophaceae bacterium]
MKRGKKEWAVLILGIWVVLGVASSALTFMNKVIEIVQTVPNGEVAGFAVIQVGSYLLAALGFFCLFIWSFLRGDFKEMEKAKYQLLEIEEKLERDEAFTREKPTRSLREWKSG